MRLWKILLALLLALTGSSPSALASIPLAQENLCTGPFRGVVSGIRYYNPTQGRWIGRDSAGEQQGGINLFSFVRNHPITAIDINGKMEWDDIAEWVQNAVNYIQNGLNEEGGGAIGMIPDLVSGKIADISVNYAPWDMIQTEMASELQEIQFMKNAQSLITGKISTATAANFAVGIAVGAVAQQVNAAGGNGDDVTLDAAVAAAGSVGVDAAETIWGVASTIAGP